MAPTPDLTSVAVTAGNAIGRAFSVITLLPALFFVGVTWTLLAADAFTGPPDADAFLQSVQQLSLGGVGALLLTAFALGYARRDQARRTATNAPRDAGATRTLQANPSATRSPNPRTRSRDRTTAPT